MRQVSATIFAWFDESQTDIQQAHERPSSHQKAEDDKRDISYSTNTRAGVGSRECNDAISPFTRRCH